MLNCHFVEFPGKLAHASSEHRTTIDYKIYYLFIYCGERFVFVLKLFTLFAIITGHHRHHRPSSRRSRMRHRGRPENTRHEIKK